MRSTLLRISFQIPDAFYHSLNVAAIRLHDLNDLAHRKFIFLLQIKDTIFICFSGNSQINIILFIGIAVIDLRSIIWLSIEKSGGKSSISAACDLLLVPWKIFFINLSSLSQIIQCLAVSSCHRCHIKCSLHTTLDLQAVHTCFHQIRQMIDHAQIFGIKDVSSSLIFINRHIFSRSGLLYNGIFPTAGMGTSSLIGISSSEEIAEQTSSRIRDAHGAVDKCLNLQAVRNMISDLTDLFQ